MTELGRNAESFVLADKQARVRDAHVAPLNELADRIADARGLARGAVPYVDPDLGGIHARALILLDNPSKRAEAGTGSGLLSLDNADRTAKACRESYARHGVQWHDLVHWNVCPFPTAGKDGASLASERAAGAQWVREFVTLCPDLKVVLPLGRNAEDGWERAHVVTDAYVFPPGVPHCSQPGLSSAASRERFETAIATLAKLLAP